nr:acyl-CoA dehydrogenase family protein [Sphingomonas chungangi]
MGSLSTLTRVRRHADARAEMFAADLWEGMTRFGIPGLLVPEAYGGLGLDILDAAVVAEVLGRHVVPAPFLGPVVAAPLAIGWGGSGAIKSRLLPRLAGGELRIGLAWSSPAGERNGEAVIERSGRLTGTCPFAIDIAGSEMIVVGSRDGRFHLVDRAAEGLSVTPVTTVDRTRSVAALVLDDVAAEGLALSPSDRLRLDYALQVMLAADLLGSGSRLLESAVEYAKARHQFGRPIGSFQAVQHLCADMAAELEPGRALLWYAAHGLDAGLPDAGESALHAKAYLADAARMASRKAVEVHGGIGITDELGLHYWFKRVTWSGQAFGGAIRTRERVACLHNAAVLPQRGAA